MSRVTEARFLVQHESCKWNVDWMKMCVNQTKNEK